MQGKETNGYDSNGAEQSTMVMFIIWYDRSKSLYHHITTSSPQDPNLSNNPDSSHYHKPSLTVFPPLALQYNISRVTVLPPLALRWTLTTRTIVLPPLALRYPPEPPCYHPLRHETPYTNFRLTRLLSNSISKDKLSYDHARSRDSMRCVNIITNKP